MIFSQEELLKASLCSQSILSAKRQWINICLILLTIWLIVTRSPDY